MYPNIRGLLQSILIGLIIMTITIAETLNLIIDVVGEGIGVDARAITNRQCAAQHVIDV